MYKKTTQVDTDDDDGRGEKNNSLSALSLSLSLPLRTQHFGCKETFALGKIFLFDVNKIV